MIIGTFWPTGNFAQGSTRENNWVTGYTSIHVVSIVLKGSQGSHESAFVFCISFHAEIRVFSSILYRFLYQRAHSFTIKHMINQSTAVITYIMYTWSSRDNIHPFIISTRVSIRPCLFATVCSVHVTCTSVSTHSFDAVVQLSPSDAHSNKLVGAGSGVSVPNNVIGGVAGVSFVLLIVLFFRFVCFV